MEGDKALWGKAWAEIAKVGEAADKKTGADQEQKRESDLRYDEALSEAMVSAATAQSAVRRMSDGDHQVHRHVGGTRKTNLVAEQC